MRVALLTAVHLVPYRALMLEAYAMTPDAFTSTAEERAAEPESWWIKRLADSAGQTAAFGAVPAESLYRSLGFKEFGVEPMAMRVASGYLAKVHMWVQLGGRG